MKKILLLLFALCTMMGADAQGLVKKAPVKNAAALRIEQAMKSPRKAAPAKISQTAITPQGTPKHYEMSAYINTLFGLGYADGLANTVYFAEDGKTIYLGSFFPDSFRTNELWIKGTIEGNNIVISKDETVFYLDYYGFGEYTEMKVAEAILDSDYNITGVKDLVLNIDGDRIYLDDDMQNPSRYVILYFFEEGELDFYDLGLCYSLTPYEGNTDLVEVPADAQVSDYIYYSTGTFGEKNARKGSVAVSGNDYFFNGLIPDASTAWVKATRNGNTITLPPYQYIGNENGYYLYLNGFYAAEYDEENEVYLGDVCDLTFTVAEDGTITLDNADDHFPGAFLHDGYQYDATYNNVIVPYTNDVPEVPSDPYELYLYDDFYDEYQAYVLDFNLDNISADGKYLNPERLGYYIYVDDERYTFTKDVYTMIEEEEMTLMPYGYSDSYGYDIYAAGNWNEVFLYEDMFEAIGVQAAYTVDGVEKLSDIVYIDLDGNTTTVAPSGISNIEAAPAVKTPWYDLAGRKTNAQRHGIYAHGGKLILR